MRLDANPLLWRDGRMIQAFVDRYMARKGELEAKYTSMAEGGWSVYRLSYLELVKDVVRVICDPEAYSGPDPDRVMEIDHGEYQGTHVYVIGATGYQPSDYWYCRVYYGSCSGCDSLQAAESVADVMTLCLHIVQKLKKMDDVD